MKNDNKLIAEFMGMEDHQEMGEYITPNYKTWEWLKPVVEKIWHKSDMWDISDIDDDECTNIADALYNAVVEFIKNQKN